LIPQALGSSERALIQAKYLSNDLRRKVSAIGEPFREIRY